MRVNGQLRLSSREREVIRAVVDDCLSMQEAAAKFFVSKHTIETHLNNIYSKLAVRSKVELARWYWNEGRNGTAN
jgi:DNA-binding CsgD family transcriptional regulator